MPVGSYSDLLAFIAVAQERSFTRAAAQLGVSQSALSHNVRALEARMGVRLLTRTTRSVSPTEAGERLLESVVPQFGGIEAELAAVGELRDKAAGTIRISASENAVNSVLWPKLASILPKYPDLNVEMSVDHRYTDIVKERYDMGVRLGDELARDMTAVPISPSMRVAIVGTPDYFSRHLPPEHPQDLSSHQCINLRLMSHGELYAWEFRKGDQQINARVSGQLTFNGPTQILQAALAGFGLGLVLEQNAAPYIATGELCRVLADWCPEFPGYHLYYPNRQQLSRAMTVVIDALRYSPDNA
ncbi:LysR family transcriptional regulator [Pseudomonas fluorescens]|uniref:LysR family transcriptional regulator n=1 Tax=Pseudomonas fluorescens TaxID=294 RepID=UPI003748DB61